MDVRLDPVWKIFQRNGPNLELLDNDFRDVITKSMRAAFLGHYWMGLNALVLCSVCWHAMDGHADAGGIHTPLQSIQFRWR
jgi:hypothetical protein